MQTRLKTLLYRKLPMLGAITHLMIRYNEHFLSHLSHEGKIQDPVKSLKGGSTSYQILYFVPLNVFACLADISLKG